METSARFESAVAAARAEFSATMQRHAAADLRIAITDLTGRIERLTEAERRGEPVDGMIRANQAVMERKQAALKELEEIA